MKIAIVIGATGVVGKKLVDRLAKQESIEKIIAITRRAVEYQSNKVVNEVVNFDKLENHRDIFQGDIFFSCLGTTAKQAGSLTKQRLVDFDYQYNAAKICVENNVKHYMLVSSNGANANSKSSYLKMKGELENEILLLPFQRISILQPSLLLGERDDFRLGEVLASWILPTLCQLPFLKRYRPISGDEVAKKMVTLSSLNGNTKAVYKLDELFS